MITNTITITNRWFLKLAPFWTAPFGVPCPSLFLRQALETRLGEVVVCGQSDF
jgi:hypothetical protein